MEHLILTGFCLKPEAIIPNGGFPMRGVIKKSIPLFIRQMDLYYLVSQFCLCCLFYWPGFSLVVAGEGYSLAALRALLTETTSLVSGHGVQGAQASAAVGRSVSSGRSGPQSTGSIVVAHKPCCSTACGIFLDPGRTHISCTEQVDSLPLSHQENLSANEC